MKRSYLEVTFRKGKALAAYLYLPRKKGAKSAKTEAHSNGVLIDFDKDGEPIGVEITVPGQTTLETINEVLSQLGQEPLDSEDIAPMKAA